MSYRRLFHLLLIGSTLTLAGVWWQSVRSYSDFIFTPLRGGLSVSSSLYSATLGLNLTSHNTRSSSLSFLSTTEPELLSSLRGSYRATGNFHLSNEKHKSSIFGGPYEVYQLRLPLWFPWLLFIGSAYALTRLMERRSASGKEKNLAASRAGGELPKLRG